MTTVLNALLDVEDDAGDREHQGFQGVLPEDQPLWGAGVMIEEAVEALYTQQ